MSWEKTCRKAIGLCGYMYNTKMVLREIGCKDVFWTYEAEYWVH